MNLLAAFVNAFKVPDLRKKILFTLLIMAVYRLGSHIPTPGIDVEAAQQFASQAQGGVFSTPYMDLTGAFIVKDHRREEFSSRAALRRLQAPGIGLLNSPYYIDLVHRYLPQATLVPLNSITEFFEGRGEELDAFLSSA